MEFVKATRVLRGRLIVYPGGQVKSAKYTMNDIVYLKEIWGHLTYIKYNTVQYNNIIRSVPFIFRD